MNRLSLMVLALTMSSPTLLAGVVENYDFKENHDGKYTLYFKKINDKEARLMQLDIYNYDAEIVIPSVVKVTDKYGSYEFKVTAIGQFYNKSDNGVCTNFSDMDPYTRIFGNVEDYANYIKSVTIPESVKSIWPSAFSGSYSDKYGLGCKSLTIPGNVTEIGAGAFKYAKFEQVAIPNAVKNIYRETFDHCVNLKSINLGNGVIEIWDDAFRDIANNAEIHIDAVTPPKISNYAFSSGYTAKVFVPYGTSEDYRSKWSTFSELTFVEMEPGQTSGVSVGKAPTELHVECNHGCLYATAASVIRIYSISGTLVHSGSGIVNVSLPAGLYLVKSGTDVVKILVQ
jgi:hypothetical protein